MLPDERTTHSNTLSLPSDVEGPVAAPGRGVARPLVDFLRGQGINVQTTSDADSAFEAAPLPPARRRAHRRPAPARGRHRAVSAVEGQRAHPLRARDRLRARRSPDAPLARARRGRRCRVRPRHGRARAAHASLVAAANARALSTTRQEATRAGLRDRRPPSLARPLPARSAGAGGRAQRQRRLLGQAQRRREATYDWRIFSGKHRGMSAPCSLSSWPTCAVGAGLRYDRYETAQLVPQETLITLGNVASDVADELRRQAVVAERPFSFARPPAATERRVQGDRELLRRAMLNLGLSGAAPRARAQRGRP